MPAEKHLTLSAIAFAVLWTAGMMWWNSPLDVAPFVILAICGIIAGVLWYWLMAKWLRWTIARADNNPST